MKGHKVHGPVDDPDAPGSDEAATASDAAVERVDEAAGHESDVSGPSSAESAATPAAEGAAASEGESSSGRTDPEPESGTTNDDVHSSEVAESAAGDDSADAGEAAPAPDDKKKWFIIHTYSGFENKVLQSLRQRADAYGMGDKIGEILVPTEDVAEIRDGKKVVTKKKIFPGYVLVNMEMSDEAWHVVRSTPKVTGFLGSGQKPLPMPQVEVNRILNQVHVTKEKPKPKFDYRVGETVKITDGPFSNFTGVVEEVNEDRSTLKVMVSIFGRATPVELEFHQVKRLE